MVGDEINDIRSYHYIANEKGDTCSHDYFDGHFLEDGEILRITWCDGTQDDVKISLHQTTPTEQVEFGGGFHGFKHWHTNKVAIIKQSGRTIFLGLEDDIRIERVNSPLGDKITER